MQTAAIKDVNVSRFILGSNTFSGFSHQSPEADLAMKRFFTYARIKDTIRQAETLGVNTMIARADQHVMRMFMEYWDEGGKVQWFAQTCPEVGSHQVCAERAAANGARACHLHGGVMDYTLAQGRMSEIPDVIKMIRDKGMLAGIAGHNHQVFEWAEANSLDVDYYMCSYYNPTNRGQRAAHVSGETEWFLEEDRAAMVKVISKLPQPVIHYKILAAGRNDPAAAFAFAASHMRRNDAVCVGVYPKDHPDMVRQDVDLLMGALSGSRG